MDRDAYDSLNFEQKQAKWPEAKISFILNPFLTIFVKIISWRFLFFKNAVLEIFQSKLPPVSGDVFVYFGQLGVVYDSQATNTSAAGGGWLSLGVISASYWSPGSRLWLPVARLRIAVAISPSTKIVQNVRKWSSGNILLYLFSVFLRMIVVR